MPLSYVQRLILAVRTFMDRNHIGGIEPECDECMLYPLAQCPVHRCRSVRVRITHSDRVRNAKCEECGWTGKALEVRFFEKLVEESEQKHSPSPENGVAATN